MLIKTPLLLIIPRKREEREEREIHGYIHRYTCTTTTYYLLINSLLLTLSKSRRSIIHG